MTIILPAWLWLVIFVIAISAMAIRWARTVAIDNPRSKRAVTAGVVIPNAQVENVCRSAILNHELTTPDQTRFIAFLPLLAFTGAGDSARTPVCLGLTDYTLGVSYKSDSLGSIATILINRRDIEVGCTTSTLNEYVYSMKAPKAGSMTFKFQSDNDLNVLESWVHTDSQGLAGSVR